MAHAMKELTSLVIWAGNSPKGQDKLSRAQNTTLD